MPEILKAPVPVLQCMDMIGGNHLDSYLIRSPGLDVWVDSRPHQTDAGGDVHLLSVCGSGRVTRMVMADVAGHGETSQETARMLRRLVREHINYLDQSRLVRDVNEAYSRHIRVGRFATMLFMTYYAPTGHLIVCNAGHPRPFHYSIRLGRWRPLDHHTPDTGPSIRGEKGIYGFHRVANLPLGIIPDTDYIQFDVHLDPGDLVVAATDALVEAHAPDGRQLGEGGLQAMLEALPVGEPAAFGPALLAAVDRFRADAPPDDDQTLLVAQRTGTPVPRPGLRQFFRLLGRLLRRR
jgi:serine phosphatase RsbU (regulator of sigma subunit)